MLREEEAFIKVLVREAMSFRADTYPVIAAHLAPYAAAGAGILADGVAAGEVRDDRAEMAAMWAIPIALVAAALELGGAAATGDVAALAITVAVTVGILSLDIAGTTPWYPGTINSLGNRFDVELIEERCTGAAACVQVCPRDVLRMDGKRRKVTIARPEACIRCGACIVQCPDDALRFRFEDGRVVEPATVRSTHLNMLGRRTTSPARERSGARSA